MKPGAEGTRSRWFSSGVRRRAWPAERVAPFTVPEPEAQATVSQRPPPGAGQLSGALSGPWQPSGGDLYRMCDYQRAALRVDTLYQKDGRLFCFALVDEAGREQRFVSGEVLA